MRMCAAAPTLLGLALLASLAGCDKDSPSDLGTSATSATAAAAGREVVLYTSVDEPVARPIVEEFRRRTGITVSIVTDTEAFKSIGLAAKLIAERDEPRADAWWGNEVFHTINLAEAGVLEPYESPSAGDVPPRFKDARHRWAGSALRVRVIAVAELPAGRAPLPPVKGLEDLTGPAFKGRVAMARPTAGTTGGHVAALYVLWGQEKADDYFRRLAANDVRLLGGNSVVAEQVGRGQVWAGLTDNDDVAAMRREGGKLTAVLPDQETFGTLTIPCTAALVAGAEHPEPAKQLIDYLLSAEVEQQLIEAGFARSSVRGGDGEGGGADKIKPMDVDYAAAAKMLPKAVESAMTILEHRE